MTPFVDRRDHFGRPLRSITELLDFAIPFDSTENYHFDDGLRESSREKRWNDMGNWIDAHGKRLLYATSPTAYAYFDQRYDFATVALSVSSQPVYQFGSLLPSAVTGLGCLDILVTTQDKHLLRLRNVLLVHKTTMFTLSMYVTKFPVGTTSPQKEVPRLVGVHLLDGVLFYEQSSAKSHNPDLHQSLLLVRESRLRRRKLRHLSS